MSPTQVVVERAFSTLNHVFGCHRSQLKGCLLDDILLICLNADLFELVNMEDISELQNLTTKDPISNETN